MARGDDGASSERQRSAGPHSLVMADRMPSIRGIYPSGAIGGGHTGVVEQSHQREFRHHNPGPYVHAQWRALRVDRLFRRWKAL
jgi:hypothetical protein